MNSEKELLKRTLLDLVKSENGMVISLNGIWGIGKTYFWNECAQSLDKEKYAYVSLFGKGSINDIRSEIFLQISVRNAGLDKFKKTLGKSNLAGVDVGAILTLFESKDLNKTVIAIDDLERISSNLSIMDVMGLVSELKEQKNCKIILISNIEQIKEADNLNAFVVSKLTEKATNAKFSIKKSNNEDIFNRYSEKIIDYNFAYSPTIEENFSCIKGELEPFESKHILFLLSRTNSDSKNFNIRLMKKLARSLRLFYFLDRERIENEMLNSISTYIFEKIYSKTIDNSVFRKMDISPLYFKINKILSLGFIDDQEGFAKEVHAIQQKLNSIVKNQEFIKDIECFVDRYKYDISYGEVEFANNLYNKIQNKVEDVYYLLGHDSVFYFTNKLLPEMDQANKEKYLELWIEIAKKKIDSVFDKVEDPTSIYSNDYLNPFNKNKELTEYIQIKKTAMIKDKLSHDGVGAAIGIVEKLINQSGWSSKEENYLSSIPPNLHEEYIKASSKYLEMIHRFCFSLNRYSGSKPFFEVYNNYIIALTNLEKNPKYKMKIKRLLDELGEPKNNSPQNNTKSECD
jgi:hypothetical protein